MNIAQLQVLLHSMIVDTDRDGYTTEDYVANAMDVIDSAQRTNLITQEQHNELNQWLIDTF